MDYLNFVGSKIRRQEPSGIEPLSLPDFLFDFQTYLDDWAVRLGRCAIFADCGLGKTPIELVWSDNFLRHTNRPVLIAAPLAVSRQFVSEGEKFGIEVHRTQDGTVRNGINVTNYEQLHKFDPKVLRAFVSDESSILKNLDGKTRKVVTEFCKSVPYCLLCTATPAPNDHMELGTSSEAVGVMKYERMLGTFFETTGNTQHWALKPHAKKRFWQWVASWSRALRRPSDLGFDDDGFILPGLDVIQHVVRSDAPRYGFFAREAKTLNEQRQERRSTLKARCEQVAELVPKRRPFIAWCHLNDEGDLLEEIIPGAVQVAGSDRDEVKEERIWAFTQGEIDVLVTKPTIAGFGLNWQHVSDVSFFPSHSHESWYQAIRRCHRFGQKREVKCHIVTSEREGRVLNNMLRKEKLSIELYDGIVREMRRVVQRENGLDVGSKSMEVPAWL